MRKLLGLTAIIAVVISQALLLRKNAFLSREVEALRRETGQLELKDDSRINLINLPTGDPLIYRWRIFAPAGTSFDVGIQVGDVPPLGVGSASFQGAIIETPRSGSLLTFAITQGLDGEYIISIDFDNQNRMCTRTRLDPSEWLHGSSSTFVAGKHGVDVFDFDEPLILHRIRLMEPVSATVKRTPAENARGVLFWLTPNSPP